MKNQFVGKVSVGEVLSYVFLTIVLVFCVLPLIFMTTAAFMDAKQIMSMPYTWIPSSEYFTTSTRTFFTNFQKAIVGNHGDNIFFRNLFNSLIVASVCAITTVLLASLCGFGLAKYKFRGQKAVFMAIMSTMMIPFEAIMIPLYLVATKMNIINTIPGLNSIPCKCLRCIPDETVSHYIPYRILGCSKSRWYGRIWNICKDCSS